MSPRISVVTPSWNRGPYLYAVWESLNAQTYRDFEWIVANDGSTDDTVEIVSDLAKKSNFPITLVSASERVGKSRIDNEGIKQSRGEFIVWCDSDDTLYPDALEVSIGTWESIPVLDREHYCGVTALNDTEDGVLGQHFYTEGQTLDMTWNDFYDKLRADHLIFTRADLLKKNNFLEVDFLISESSLWRQLGVLKTRFNPVVLQRRNYGQDNALSGSGHMSYNRGHAYAMASTKKFLLKKSTLPSVVWISTNYLRYCLHGDLSLRKAIELWGGGLGGLTLTMLWPISFLIALKDQLQGKVRKTHLEFDQAKNRAIIKSERVNFSE